MACFRFRARSARKTLSLSLIAASGRVVRSMMGIKYTGAAFFSLLPLKNPPNSICNNCVVILI